MADTTALVGIIANSSVGGNVSRMPLGEHGMLPQGCKEPFFLCSLNKTQRQIARNEKNISNFAIFIPKLNGAVCVCVYVCALYISVVYLLRYKSRLLLTRDGGN